jgi:NADPH:quinone reductase-like Zn-dependent oxidoreductase
MMQAVIMNRFGGADVLHLAERPKPEPKPGEVLIRTHCVGVNYIDTLTRAGKGVPVEKFPAIVGWDLAGAVAALGAGVTRFRVGDAVFGMPRFPRLAEAYAQYVSAPAHELAFKPAALDDATAASAPMIGLTAWLALFTQGDLRAANPAGEALAREEGVRVERVFVQPNGEALEKIADRLGTGKLKVAVSRTVPLAEVSAAHAIVERARGRGRIVLDVTG